MREKSPTTVDKEVKPCRHMACWVSSLADGTLSGFARWYTRLHLAECKQCKATLDALISLRERLKALPQSQDPIFPATLSEQNRTALDAALDAVDRKASG